MPQPSPEPVTIGSHPRDLPRSAYEGSSGSAVVLSPASAPLRIELGDMVVHELPLDVGAELTVEVTARHDGRAYEESWRFRVTGDDADVDHHTVGPGLTVERGRWGGKTYQGFEFGVLVMGAVRLD